MSFSASAADERVLDVQSADDTLSVSLRDGRVITVPPGMVSASAPCHACAAPELGDCRRWLWHPLARPGRGLEHGGIATRRSRPQSICSREVDSPDPMPAKNATAGHLAILRKSKKGDSGSDATV